MNRKLTITLLSAAVLGIGFLASGRGASPAAEVPQAALRQAVPDHVIYRMLLHHAYVASQQAEEAERAGNLDAAHAHRAFLKQAKLSDEQARTLGQIAADCEREVAALDARARVIIDARRALYTTGVQPKRRPLPSSPELQELQRERNAAILRARDRLHASLGEQAWTRLEVFVNSRIVPGLTITQTAAAQIGDASGVESDQ